MTALPHQDDYITENDYLELDHESEIKYEYMDGEMIAMSGGSWHHSVIISNINRLLGNQLTNQPCTVVSSDMRLHVASAKAYRYPDIIVICGDPEFYQERTDIITNPIVLIEVLSQSTASTDHIEKRDEYVQIPSLEEYLLVSQDKPLIQRYLRQENGAWLFQQVSGLKSLFKLPSINCTLRLVDVYNSVTFEPKTMNDDQ